MAVTSCEALARDGVRESGNYMIDPGLNLWNAEILYGNFRWTTWNRAAAKDVLRLFEWQSARNQLSGPWRYCRSSWRTAARTMYVKIGFS